jgi:hypothetical protein
MFGTWSHDAAGASMDAAHRTGANIGELCRERTDQPDRERSGFFVSHGFDRAFFPFQEVEAY